MNEDDLRKKLLGLLPLGGTIAGGILGGLATTPSILGVPAGIMGGGATGAAGGEALRQRLLGEKEDVGKIATEGAFGAAAGPIGKGMGFIAGKTIAPVLRGTGKALSRITGINTRELMQTALPIKPSILAQSARRKIDVYKELLDEKIQGDRVQMANQIENAITKHGNILKKGLEEASNKGIRINATEIGGLLNPLKSRLTQLAVPNNIKTPLLTQINNYQKVLNKLGSITPLEAQTQKQGLDDFINFAVKDPKLSQEILQTVRWGYKSLLEKNVKNIGVRATNTRLAALQDAGRSLQELGLKETGMGLRELMGLPSTMAAFGGPAALFGGYEAGLTTGVTLGVPVWMLSTAAKASPAFASKVAITMNQVLGTKLPTQIPQLMQLLSGQLGAKGIVSLTLPNIVGQPGQAPEEKNGQGQYPQVISPDQQPAHTLPSIPQTIVKSQIAQTITGRTAEEHAKAYQKALMAGDEDAAKQIKSLYDMESNYQKSQQPKPHTPTQIRDIALANNALRALNVVKKEVLDPKTNEVNMGKINQMRLTPKQIGYRKLYDAIFDATGARLRIESGAAINNEEIKRYVDNYFLRLFDSPDAVLYQIDQLERFLTDIKGQSPGATATLPDIGQMQFSQP